jgi:hypothetical protein
MHEGEPWWKSEKKGLLQQGGKFKVILNFAPFMSVACLPVRMCICMPATYESTVKPLTPRDHLAERKFICSTCKGDVYLPRVHSSLAGTWVVHDDDYSCDTWIQWCYLPRSGHSVTRLCNTIRTLKEQAIALRHVAIRAARSHPSLAAIFIFNLHWYFTNQSL